MAESDIPEKFCDGFKTSIHFHYDYKPIRFDKRFNGIENLSDEKAKDLLFNRLNIEIYGNYCGVLEEKPFTIIYMPRRENITNGIISIFGEGEKREEICKIILSSERTFSPSTVTCIPREGYNLIKKILKEERGKNSRLKSGLLGPLLNKKRLVYARF